MKLIYPEDRPRVAEAAAAVLRRGPRYDVEYRVVRSDGAVRVVHSRGDVTWDDAGKPLRQFGVLQDITELRRAERELRASDILQALLARMVDHRATYQLNAYLLAHKFLFRIASCPMGFQSSRALPNFLGSAMVMRNAIRRRYLTNREESPP